MSKVKKDEVICSWTAKFKYPSIHKLESPDERLYELYEVLIHKAKRLGIRFVEHIYEADGRNQRHVHALVIMNKKLFYDDYAKISTQAGFSIKIVQTGIPSWKKYMYKDVGKPGFHQGVSILPSRFKTMIEHADKTYEFCINEHINRLNDDIKTLV